MSDDLREGVCMTLYVTPEEFRRFSWNVPKEIIDALIRKKEIVIEEEVTYEK